MRKDRRGVLQGGAALGLLSAAGVAAGPVLRPAPARAQGGWSGGGVRSLGESLLGAPKYADDFPHFDYVNPDAPRGGSAAIARNGTYDSFNPFIVKGTPAGEIGLIWDTLMEPSLDEGSTHYGLLAEWMERPADDTWVAFRLRDEAAWHDGRPITVSDVVSSFELLTTKARPFFASYYKNVERVIDEGDRVVRFFFDQSGNRELPHIMGQLRVMPAHYWAERDFAEATLEPPLGGGPYRVGAFEPGRFVELERVEDYWGARLPVMIGSNNFDKLRYEYFFDTAAAFEAFKKGDIDFWDETSASRWAEQYAFPAAQRGEVVKREVMQEGPKVVQALVFNTRREKFADRRVREALALAFDFEYLNDKVFRKQYARPSSYFQGSDDLMAAGAPEGAELALLEPFRDQLPSELFEKPFSYPKNDGSGRARRVLVRAQRLLEEAGLTIVDKKLRLPNGEPFTLEFLSPQSSQERVIGPYIQNLEILGVEASFRLIDGPQYVARRDSFDYDMIIWGWANSDSPGNEQRDFWGSATAALDGGRNKAGVANPAVDALIEKIIFAEDRTALAAATRALDRVLLWEHYAVLELYTPFERIAFWDRFGAPDPLPSRSIGFPAVWWSKS